MLFYFSVYSLIALLIIAVLFIFLPIKLTRKQLLGFWGIYIVLLAIFGFNIDPGSELDLYRLYDQINLFRMGQSSILSSPLIIMNIIYWIVAQTNDNGWLVVIAVGIWGGCIGKVTSEYLKDNQYRTRSVMLFYLAASGGCFLFYLLTNIRCSIAFAIWLYAYQIWYKKNKAVYFILSLSTVFIHIVGIITLGIASLYEFLNHKKRVRGYIVSFFAILLIGYLMSNTAVLQNFLDGIGTDYGSYLSQKWTAYSIRGYEFQQNREMIFRILTSLLYLILIIILHFKNKKENDIIGFFIMIMYAGFNMSIIFERIPYLLGIASLPIINESSVTLKGVNKKLFYIVSFIILFGQIIWSIYETMLWTNFKNGIYFGDILQRFS